MPEEKEVEPPPAKRRPGRPPGAKNKTRPGVPLRQRAPAGAPPGEEAGEPAVVDHRPPEVQRDDFGPRPEMVTPTQWTGLKQLHVKLAHPATTIFQRLLRRAQACPEIIAVVAVLRCQVCEELARPPSDRRAALHDDAAQQFNDDVYMDDLEMVLSDGSKIMYKALIGERTALVFWRLWQARESSRQPKDFERPGQGRPRSCTTT